MDSEALARYVADQSNRTQSRQRRHSRCERHGILHGLLVLASGTSDRHVQSIAEGCAESLKNQGVRTLSSEGLREGQWALVDFGDVVLHVFHQFTRDVYDLETLWQQAKRLENQRHTCGYQRLETLRCRAELPRGVRWATTQDLIKRRPRLRGAF
ncbi:MAG: ribosome silencing factor [Myxococcota bacterium]